MHVYSHDSELLFIRLILLWKFMIELVSFADSVTRKKPCLIGNLNTQDTVPLDFFLGKELLVTEEKVWVL